MNDFNLLTMLECLITLYDERKISLQGENYSPAFTALIGNVRDALSNIE